MRKLPFLLLSLAGCVSQESAAPILTLSVPDDDPGIAPDPTDGKGLYLQNCASCHNANGDGEGELAKQLGVKARSFAQGGFAFGNTREAIFRTITAGMPGSSAMPSFQTKLSDEQRLKIAEFVITLTPTAGQKENSEGSVLKLGDRAQIVRGKLPPLADGLPERPRGLLIGVPGGLSFEYRIDDVRFLGTRMGDFVDRQDWRDRGGSELKPLGKLFYKFFEGDPPAITTGDFYESPLKATLRASQSVGRRAELEYELESSDREIRAGVREAVMFEPITAGGTFTRFFTLHNKGKVAQIAVPLGGSAKEQKWSRRGEWWVGEIAGSPAECLLVSLANRTTAWEKDGRLFALVSLGVDSEARMEVTTALVADASLANLKTLAAEIRR